jgi:L-asparaginase
MSGVTVLAAGGTIAMSAAAGARVTPELDAGGLVAAVPALAGHGDLEARTVDSRPSAQLDGAGALAIARAAAEEAASGRGVVVTHGTDTLEEVAFLCDLLYGGDAPVVFTGAMRPASAPGADGPANLLDAVALAGSEEAAGLGVLVAFAGEVHAARAVRKSDSTGPGAFDSPGSGPLGRVAEGRARLERRVERRPPLAVERLDAEVHAVGAGLAAGGALVDAAVAAGADGLVAGALGAGHASPAFVRALERAAARVPVIATVRPERGAILHATYGFEGAEGDLRASGAICAGALSPAAARVKLMACLGAGCDRAAIAAAFAPDDR